MKMKMIPRQTCSSFVRVLPNRHVHHLQVVCPTFGEYNEMRIMPIYVGHHNY